MNSNQIDISVKNFRAINKAHIALNGITVVAGANGSGKSTLSKLTYLLFKTSINFEKIVEKKTKQNLQKVIRALDIISRDLSYFTNKKNYAASRSRFRKFTVNDFSKDLFGENQISLFIDSLIEEYNNLDNKIKKRKFADIRLERSGKILLDIIPAISINDEIGITELLIELKKFVNGKIEETFELKEQRPIQVLYDELYKTFYNKQLRKNVEFKEFDVSIIDRKENTLIPIHTIQNVIYVDTPMMIGIDTYGDIEHWDDLNELLEKKESYGKEHLQSNIQISDIIKGNIIDNDDEFSDMQFIYKREDGSKFDLMECATGLKSFAILQLLYKKGFLNDKSLLIIDEPEAHLHPQWVVEYARIIILLHKTIGVKFLIASHHPDMISAIKYIAEKEEVIQNVQYYLSKQIDEKKFQFDFKYLGSNIEEIFSSFNIAFERIDLYGKTD